MKAAADGTFAKLEQKVDEKMAQVDQRIDVMASSRKPSLKPSLQSASTTPSAVLRPMALSVPPASSTGGSMSTADMSATAKAFENVPKSELISLLAKTNGRCKQLEMRLAELKTLHVALLEEKRQLVATKGRAGSSLASERDSLEVTLRQEYEDQLSELEEQVTSSGGIKKQLQTEVGRLTSELHSTQALLAAAEVASVEAAASKEALVTELRTLQLAANEQQRRAEMQSSTAAAEQTSLMERVMKLQGELSTARVASQPPTASTMHGGLPKSLRSYGALALTSLGLTYTLSCPSIVPRPRPHPRSHTLCMYSIAPDTAPRATQAVAPHCPPASLLTTLHTSLANSLANWPLLSRLASQVWMPSIACRPSHAAHRMLPFRNSRGHACG